ncbi:hypothetical protein EJB05_13226 [Eragrostis curvula]|uniref:Uncharacterized protein n=1 Tax=Eragrostis curvula TaxID=38414 RepID=A0A5J9VVX3_9POAL|nr:hypothetical protein EJB05_13226 [Eragrostis curvula]
MESTRKPCFLTILLLFSLLVSTVHGAELSNARDAGERTTVRTGAAGHAGHGYSGHSGAHPNGTPEQQGGAGVVDPRNLAARSHHRSGAASRATGYSPLVTCVLLGTLLMVVRV